MATNRREQVQRMVNAAEEWGRALLHMPVTASTVQEPVCCADGSLQTTIALQAEGRQPQRLQCLVTLEPDGTLSCFAPDPDSR